MPLRLLAYQSICFALFLGLAVPSVSLAEELPWSRHVIDDTSAGADGVRLADVNGDGLPDIATGWEEGGLVRIYLHPGAERVKQPWPRATVGKVRSPEDAVWADVNGDGQLEVVSSCEGKERCIFIHSPQRGDDLLASNWKTTPITATRGHSMWMYAAAIDADGRHGDDLIVGGKGPGAIVGWLQAPDDPFDGDAWKLHELYRAGWIMSIEVHDFDGDGHADVLISDRRGPTAGVHLLLNPGPQANRQGKPWERLALVQQSAEFMFLDVVDFDGDGRQDVVCAVKGKGIYVLYHPGDVRKDWPRQTIAWPDGCGREKAVAAGDLTGDGRIELVVSCEGADPPKSGLKWLSYRDSHRETEWQAHELSGPAGVKFDRMELVDLDGDGDLDVLTCCERPGLGVIWYENP